MIAATFVTLAVILVLLASTDAKLSKRDRVKEYRGSKVSRAARDKFLNIPKNPLASKVERNVVTGTANDQFAVESANRQYANFMVFSDASCSFDNMQMISSMQVNKCYLAGGTDDEMMSKAAEYEWNMVSMNTDGDAVLTQYMMRGHCQDASPDVISSMSYTYPTTCFEYETGWWAMVSLTDMLPAWTSTEGLVVKTFDAKNAGCMHAVEETWIRNGYCGSSGSADDDSSGSWEYWCSGNGGAKSMFTLDYFSGDMGCTGTASWSYMYSGTKGMCMMVSLDDDYYSDDDMAMDDGPTFWGYQEVYCAM